MSTTTGLSVCHSSSLDKRKLFCLFVYRVTLFCYGVGAFSLPISHGMHPVVPAQFCSFGWYVISAGHFPQKSPNRNLKIGFFPLPTVKPCPLTSDPCPVLAGYRLVRSGPCAYLSFMYVQNLPAAHASAVVGLFILDHFLVSFFFMACPI